MNRYESHSRKPLKDIIKLMTEHPNDPLYGKTLEKILESLVAQYGWEELGKRITINCFIKEPSITSSLKFLRKTAWARKKVEDLYLETAAAPKTY